MEYQDGKYVMTNKISDENIKEMRNNMDESDIEKFEQFLERNWGSSKKTVEKEVKKRTKKEKQTK